VIQLLQTNCFLLVTAAVSSGVAHFSPGLGVMVWVAFLVLAEVGWRRKVDVSEATDP
jgi:hypothetical protein